MPCWKISLALVLVIDETVIDVMKETTSLLKTNSHR